VLLSPPLLLVICPMHIGVMFDTERHGPLIADLAIQPTWLGEFDMVHLTGALPTNEAGMGCKSPPMLLVSDPSRRTEGVSGLVNVPVIRRALLLRSWTRSILPRWYRALLVGTVGVRFGGWFLSILESFEPPPIDQNLEIAVVLVAVTHEVGEVLV
jgi:hypothetical protein